MGEWAPYAGALAVIITAGAGGLFRHVTVKFNELTEQITANELRNQGRHEENLERLTALETIVLNGHTVKRNRRSRRNP